MTKIEDAQQIVKENENKIEEIKPLEKLPAPKYENEVVTKTIVVLSPVQYKSKLLEAKKEYLTNTDIKPHELARKHGIKPIELQQIIQKENWDRQRLQVYTRADERVKQLLEVTLAEVKSRHILIAKMVQKLGQKSLRKAKPILGPRDSLAYITEGVRMEREAYGMDKQSPKVINIIAQQNKIIEKYKK